MVSFSNISNFIVSNFIPYFSDDLDSFVELHDLKLMGLRTFLILYDYTYINQLSIFSFPILLFYKNLHHLKPTLNQNYFISYQAYIYAVLIQGRGLANI